MHRLFVFVSEQAILEILHEDVYKRQLQDMAQAIQELPDADTEKLTLPESWST